MSNEKLTKQVVEAKEIRNRRKERSRSKYKDGIRELEMKRGKTMDEMAHKHKELRKKNLHKVSNQQLFYSLNKFNSTFLHV